MIHWDDFTGSLTKPLLPLPCFADDIHATMRVLDRLAQEDGVSLLFPTLWQREDPWPGVTA